MRELLEEALKYLSKYGTNFDLEKRIEAELAKPAEPVAWMYKDHLGTYFSNSGNPEHGWLPLYTQPPAQHKPLSTDEIADKLG